MTSAEGQTKWAGEHPRSTLTHSLTRQYVDMPGFSWADVGRFETPLESAETSLGFLAKHPDLFPEDADAQELRSAIHTVSFSTFHSLLQAVHSLFGPLPPLQEALIAAAYSVACLNKCKYTQMKRHGRSRLVYSSKWTGFICGG